MMLAYNKYRASLYLCEKEDADLITAGDQYAKDRAFFVGLLADEHGEAIDPKVIDKLVYMSRLGEALKMEIKESVEIESSIKKLAKKVLTDSEVDGDKQYCPDVVEIVEMLVNKIQKL